MSSSTDPKPTSNDEETSEIAYSVEEEDDDDVADGQSTPDHFAGVRPSLLKMPSVLNAIIDQIHPEIVARFAHR